MTEPTLSYLTSRFSNVRSVDPQNTLASDEMGVHSPVCLMRTAESSLSGQRLVQGYKASDENSLGSHGGLLTPGPSSSARPTESLSPVKQGTG